LYPSKIAEIAESAILDYYDEDLATEIQQQQEKLEAALKKAKARALRVHSERITLGTYR